MELLCNGLGFYDLDVPPGDPNFSKVFRCPNNPLEQDDDRKDTLRRLSNLGRYKDASFENFQIAPGGMSDTAEQSLHLAFTTAQRFAQNPHGKWIVFAGSYGSGKTHLAAAIGNARLEQGEFVLFVTAPDLLDTLRGSYAPDADMSYRDLFERVRQADMLILDDLGVENPSDWAKEKLFQLLNHRYTDRLATVITTNIDIDTLDPRLRSRMLDMDVVEHVRITAPDYRSFHTNEKERLSDLHLYSDLQFNNFDVRSGCKPSESQNLQKALRTAQEYAETADGWLVLMGESGTGKTHLAAAVANYWRQHGADVMFVTAPDLLDYLRRTFSAESNVTFDAQFQQVKNTPLLVLDDLDAADHTKPWVREKLVQLIKHRYVRRLPTVVTTNNTLEKLDGQIRTRLSDMRLSRLFAIATRPYVERRRSSM